MLAFGDTERSCLLCVCVCGMRRRAVLAPWLAAAMLETTAMAENSTTIKAACRFTADCEAENHECIDSRYVAPTYPRIKPLPAVG